ncbi:MAG: molybdopterin-dependent oxidoreductase [Rhodospirillales bacterium]|nr:molybdopterin-dependent oxidoreductase [Acetobacter sp.]
MLLAEGAAADAASITTSFDVTGAVLHPVTETLASLEALQPQSASVSYLSGSKSVSATFTGPTLWTVLNQAGLASVPGAKNSILRNVVVATGSDGYKVAFSGGELDPRFAGARTPDLVAYAENGQPLDADGFARTVVPGDQRGARYVSNLSNLNVVQAPSNQGAGGGRSSSFTLSGLVQHSTTYDAKSLSSLPAVTEAVTYTSAGNPVSASFTGVSLWDLLTRAGLVIDPLIKNDELRQYVLATGSDGYEATFSLGELDPRFGGSSAVPDLVAYAENGSSLGDDGFARLVVPGDAAGGRYVSNLVSLQIFDATMSTVPLPSSAPMFGAAVLALGAVGYGLKRKSAAAA